MIKGGRLDARTGELAFDGPRIASTKPGMMIDLLADVDPTDIHFRLVRLSPPPTFAADTGKIVYTLGAVVREGPGSVFANLHQVGATMEFDDPLQPGEIRSLDAGTAGKLVGTERLGTLAGTTADGTWFATGAYAIGRSGDPARPTVEFQLNDVLVSFANVEQAAFTREIFYGARLKFLIGCLGTPLSATELHSDRTEEVAFGRRTTLRDLRENSADAFSATAIVYDGLPFEGSQFQAVWLAASVLAGAALHPAAVETYDATGILVERRYRPGVPQGARGDAPFHAHYAPYPRGAFATMCERIAALLDGDFPIDVVISHMHDANDGSMERRMQSNLFAIHAASEAWNRLYEKTVLVDSTVWKSLKTKVAAAARAVADVFDIGLGDSVANSVMNANNVSSGSRLRLFFRRMGLSYAGKTKLAIELRNKLFHDGYLQRRFSSLKDEKQQERYDDLQRLRESTLRMVFALCEIDMRIHSLLNPYDSITTRDVMPERDDSAGD